LNRRSESRLELEAEGLGYELAVIKTWDGAVSITLAERHPRCLPRGNRKGPPQAGQLSPMPTVYKPNMGAEWADDETKHPLPVGLLALLILAAGEPVSYLIFSIVFIGVARSWPLVYLSRW
jgi:hypothetical protein